MYLRTRDDLCNSWSRRSAIYYFEFAAIIYLECFNTIKRNKYQKDTYLFHELVEVTYFSKIHSSVPWLINEFGTRIPRRMSYMKQEQLALPRDRSFLRVLVDFLLFDLLFSVYSFILNIALYVHLRITASDYPFSIFKLFLCILS